MCLTGIAGWLPVYRVFDRYSRLVAGISCFTGIAGWLLVYRVFDRYSRLVAGISCVSQV